MAKIYSVSDVSRNLSTIIEQHLGQLNVLVEGEISNFILHSSQHIYFNLKDDQSSIACFIHKTVRLDRSFLKNGDKVILKVKINYNQLKNETRLYVMDVKLSGEGELYAQRQKLKNELDKAGYFEFRHKKAIPEFPKSIGIITSIPSAALKDVLITLQNKCPIVDVELYPTLVQGNQASKNIIEQLLVADKSNHDVLLLVRGGGSIEDLWCFNDKELCITIFNLKTPIITGIGHEQDYTLADFVADKRSATPSVAANDAVYSLQDVKSVLYQNKLKLNKIITSLFNQNQKEYQGISKSIVFSNPTYLTQFYTQKLVFLNEKIENYAQSNLQMKIQLENKKELLHKNLVQMIKMNQLRIQLLSEKLIQLNKKNLEKNIIMNERYLALLNAYSHTKVLNRGYSIVRKGKEIISTVENLSIDDEVEIILSNGKVKAKVSDINE